MMRISPVCARLLILTFFATPLLVGCGRKDVRRYDISGKVTYHGKSVPNGTISFNAATGTLGGGYAMIVNGQYDSRETGRGHLGGAHTVTIVGLANELINPDIPDMGQRPLFPTYETVMEFAKGDETRDFDVPIKGK